MPYYTDKFFLKEIMAAKFINGYTLELVFNDWQKGRVNFEKYFQQGLLKELLDQKKFREFKIDADLGTIVWPNGADIAPETLYQEAIKNNTEIS